MSAYPARGEERPKPTVHITTTHPTFPSASLAVLTATRHSIVNTVHQTKYRRLSHLVHLHFGRCSRRQLLSVADRQAGTGFLVECFVCFHAQVRILGNRSEQIAAKYTDKETEETEIRRGRKAKTEHSSRKRSTASDSYSGRKRNVPGNDEEDKRGGLFKDIAPVCQTEGQRGLHQIHDEA